MSNTIIENELTAELDYELFAKNLLEQSEGLKKEVVIKNVIDQAQIDQMLQLSKDALLNLCDVKFTPFGFRVWRNSEKRAASYVRENVYENPPLAHEGLGDWVARTFPEGETCLIMNNSEAFEDGIAILMSRVFQPVMEKIGIPMNGTHSTYIFGNYTYTPLGIHHDDEGSFVINLHLGPATKRMYTWDWDDYVSLGGTNNDRNVEKYLSKATEHIIEPGDVFFMPWDKFHVGYNEGFSLSMTNWFDFHSADRLVSELLTYLKKFMRVKSEFFPVSVTEATHKQEFEKVMDQFLFEGGRGDISLKQNIMDAQEQKMLRYFSNGGYKSTPLAREKEAGFDKMDFSRFEGKKIRLIDPFKLITKVKGDDIYLFIRGHVRKYKKGAALTALIEKLNSHKAIEVSELLAMQPEDWLESSWRYLISTFYNLRSVEIV